MTKPDGLRLQHRIVIPFVIVAVFAASAAVWVGVSVMAATLRSRVETQLRSAATMVGQSDFALNPIILSSVKRVVGADVITFSADGTIVATTVDRQQRPALVAAVTAPDIARSALSSTRSEAIVVPVRCDVPCYAAFYRVAARPDTLVAVVADASELNTAIGKITRTIFITAILGVVAMVLVSQMVARRVTKPLLALVDFTRAVSPGATSARAPAGQGEVGQLGVAFNDMLERLDRSQAALVRSEKLALAGLFAARVAHDIRNPLSSIKMQTQLLQARTRGDADSQSMTDAVLADIQTVELVVRDLLELARPGDLRKKPVKLNNVVLDLLVHLAPQLRYRNVDVETRLDEHLPQIPLDADRFRQALLNVLGNATDAMPTGGTLSLASRLSADRSTVELDVCDDGEGVDPAVLPRIFDPFVSTKRDGVGLGLVNTRAIVESHGGRVELAAREPRGTRVTIWLPVRDAAHG